jgi:dihydropteroate synthase
MRRRLRLPGQSDPSTRPRPAPSGGQNEIPYRRALRLAGNHIVRLPAIMGILNVTPDSFADGGCYLEPARAAEHAIEMAEAGATLIDIGGESTRPGALEVAAQEELRRVLPVLKALRARLKCPLSVDTRKASVAEAALGEGASLINDVSGLQFDPAMAATVARFKAGLVIMHMRGTPATMARMARYRDVVTEVKSSLSRQAALALDAGVARSRIIIDPGIGFAKKPSHNIRLLAALAMLAELGYPVMVGVSRKSFVRAISGGQDEELVLGTAAAVAVAVFNRAAIVRVHDVGAMVPVVKMAAALADGRARR